MPEEKLIVFVKAPRPGEVKTRLAAVIGPEAATQAYCHLVASVLAQVGGLAPEIRFTPTEAESELRSRLAGQAEFRPQGAGDLGRRLERAFDESFAHGCKRVVIIGSDCPAVTAADIQTAWRALSTHDLVLGPAQDGGYWLIGLRQRQPALFQDIPWGSSAVARETIKRAAQLDLAVYLLRELRDIDTAEDWDDYRK